MLPLPGWRYAGTFAAFAEAKGVYLERLKGDKIAKPTGVDESGRPAGVSKEDGPHA